MVAVYPIGYYLRRIENDREVSMLLALLVIMIAAWALTLRDVLRRRQRSAGRRAAWIVATIVLPVLVIPVYWLVRPLPRQSDGARGGAAHAPQTLADLIPGWTAERADACDQADAWAHDSSHLNPAPGFYAWLRDSGLAEKHPACAARLVRALLGGERRPSFVACPEAGALATLPEEYLVDGDDMRAIRDQLRRLCPGTAQRDLAPAAASGRPALG
jgi:hypothetical protein